MDNSPLGFSVRKQSSWFVTCAVKLYWIVTLLPPCLTVVRCSFSKWMMHTFKNVLLFSHQSMVSSRWFYKAWAKPLCSFCSGFRLETLSWVTFLSSFFLIVEFWKMSLFWEIWCCQSLDVLMVPLRIAVWVVHVVISAGPLLLWFIYVPWLFHLWIMALALVHWSPTALDVAFNISITLISPVLKFLQVLVDSVAFRRWLSLLHVVR